MEPLQFGWGAGAASPGSRFFGKSDASVKLRLTRMQVFATKQDQ